ncbi:MAG TPA: DUF5916 domain-containing protein [Gemmatimonadales bacterium]|nr:DUF5916 domain-containing protein [Gemmatimonadales bacterium]
MTAGLGLLLMVMQGQSLSGLSLGPGTPAAVPAGATAVQAVFAVAPPVLDGRDDDPVWARAPVIRDFRVVRPSEGAPPSLPTEARVAYDARNLYVFVRAFDPHPDSIVRLLSRRDVQTASDQIIVMIDSYHDRRNGYEFAVNPAGVKSDYAIYNDGNEDVAWDAVWDVATQIDSLGWTAEYRIPLSQLRYSQSHGVNFGFAVWRNIQRYTEQVSWPLIRMSKAGFVSQFGEVDGLNQLGAPRRTELMPYVLTKNVNQLTSTGFARQQDVTVGGDLKVGIASNLTLNATLNPDFGQVEADPSVLNLSAFETFFQERRPFFVEGRGLFEFDVDCSAVNCNGEGLFYSRRIGRAPELAGVYEDSTAAQATTILGAAKLTGRTSGGLSLGVLDAVTNRVSGTNGITLEPTTNYAVVRASQDLDRGQGNIGVIFTGVNRSLDQWSDSLLHREAYAGAFDFRHRFFDSRYEVSAALDLSTVRGSRQAIAQTELDPVHLYQRPDGPLVFDSTRTSLGGDAEEIHFGKVAGAVTNWETSYLRRSPGFEINDLGFLLQADQQSWNNWFGLRFNHPNRLYQRANWNFNWWQYWSAAGLPTERAANTNLHMQLNNRWWINAGATLGQLGATYCDRCARGGPAVRQGAYLSPWAYLEGDDRKPLVPMLSANFFQTDGGRTRNLTLAPELDLKVSTRFTTSLNVSYTTNRAAAQWFGNFTDSSTGQQHYTFAHLDQRTLALTWRLDFTFSRTASLQIYAQPFISKGTYSDIRELADPHAASFDARYQPYADTSVTNHPGGFDFMQFRSNVVFRWEYRRGSTLYLVWSQGRQNSLTAEGTDTFWGDLNNLFAQRPDNTFLLKVSYWLNR